MLSPVPQRLSSDADMHPVHALLVECFAYMDGRIDPPSSLNRMTTATLAEEAARNELWILPPETAPAACMLLTAKPGHLYLGKLAVSPAHRGKGLARRMIDHALLRAGQLGLPELRLQTRVELVENHATFLNLGFSEVARTAHPGFDQPTSLTFARHIASPA